MADTRCCELACPVCGSHIGYAVNAQVADERDRYREALGQIAADGEMCPLDGGCRADYLGEIAANALAGSGQ